MKETRKKEIIHKKTKQTSLCFVFSLFIFFLSFFSFTNTSYGAGDDITVSTSTAWAAGTYNYGTVTVTAGAILTLNSTISGSGLTATGSGVIINADNIVVDAGSSISANAKGFTGTGNGNGPGVGATGGCGSNGGGAGYGGTGGAASGSAGGVTYGSNTQPISLGSSGGAGACGGNTGGTGGGAIKLIISNTFTNNGTTTANGNNAGTTRDGGGSGGSIWIDAGTIAGNGSLTSNGGASGGTGGGGAGGRIALYYNTKTYSGTVTTTGGTGANAGGAGTIYQATTTANPPTSTIAYPINNGLAVSTVVNGTAVAGSDGIQKVQVAIAKSSNGYFYNGSTFASSASMVWLDATGTTSFSYTASSGAFVIGSQYHIYVRAQDNLNAYEVPKESTITYSALTSTYTNPTNGVTNPSTAFTGTSTANSINTTKISIQELDTNKYYDGGTFASDTEVWITTTGTSGWSYDASGVPFLNGTAYKLRSRAEDPYGTVETPSAGISFLKFDGLIISTNTTWSTNQNIDSKGFVVTNNATLTINAGVTVTNAGPVLLSNTSSGRIIVAGTNTILTGTAFKVIAGTGVLDVNKDIVTPPTFSSILVASGATLTHSAHTNTHIYSLILFSTGDVTVNGTISADGTGFSGGNGPGIGTGAPGYGGSGSGTSPSYGSLTQPVNLGSGGGGGVIKLIVSGIFTNNGTTSSNGSTGSGGSIWIDAGTIAGNGTITTNGGSGGAGGRIALYYNTKTYSGTVTTTGTGGAGAGTIYNKDKISGVETPTYTTFANGTDPSSVTISPGVPTMARSFTFKTSSGTDVITSILVTLSTGMYSILGLVEITSDDGSVVYGSSVNPSADIVTVTLNTNTLTANTTETQYKIRITPKSHGTMPVWPGAIYTVTANIIGNVWTDTNTKNSFFVSTQGIPTLTIDNLSPGNISSLTGTPANNQVTFNYTTPSDNDIDSIVVVRDFSASVNIPAEGGTYSLGNTIGSSTVACIDTMSTPSTVSSCIATGLTNGTTYFFRIFVKDIHGNYSSGTTPSTSPFTPPSGTGSTTIINTNTTLAAGTYTYGTLYITNNSTLTLNSTTSGSGLTATGSGVIINADNIVVDAGSTISANGTGFIGGITGSGPGGGLNAGSTCQNGGGAGYGGNGGDAGGGVGAAYGSNTQPINLGSGGSTSGSCGGAGGTGGGAIKLVVSGTFTNNGTTTANGNIGGYRAGGGSGGSIWIDAGIIAGNGSLTSNGGNSGGTSGGGGAGGRIALYFNTKTYSGTVTTTGGTGTTAGGGTGTIYNYKPFYSSGTFTSAVIDFGSIPVSPTTLTYAKTTPTSTTLTVDIRAGNTATPDGTWTLWTDNTNVASGGSIASLANKRYFQYRANLATTYGRRTPSLDNLTINYTQYTLSGNLISSIYNTSSPSNILASVGWVASNTSDTETVQFQLRSSPDGNTWSNWCGYTDCSGSTYFNAGDNGVALSGSHPLQLGGDDQYFQYKTLLASAGASTPTLSSVSIRYVVNSPPEFDTSFGGNGITVSQISDSSDPNWGKMKIDYRIRDIDTTTGTATPGFITPTFQYNTGSGFTSITSGYLSASALDNKAVQEGSYTTYTAYFDAKSQIPETSINTLQIKVTLNDNEAANNTAFATDSSLSLDTKNPTIGATPILVDATTSPATLTLSTTDDNSIQMKVSLNNDLGGASYETYNTTKTITLASDPDTIYVQYRDAYGNETAIQSITTPETPTRMMVQDTSNLYAPPLSAEYRLFVAWGTILPSTPAFASYKIYRSPDNITYTLLDTINSRTTNYYGDNSIAFDTLYYYKVETRDVNGNISYRSLPVVGKANGIQDAGEGGGGAETTAPTISTVTSTAISTTEATITWETNELATSTVGFTGTPSVFTNQIGIEGYTDNAASTGIHRVVLSGLTPNTPYYYQILSSDPSHNQGIANNGGTGYTFTTNPGPAISGVALSNASNTKATITWNTDISSDSTIRYATSVAGGSLVAPQETGTGTNVTSHSILLTSLTEGTLYYFSVKSQHNADIASDTNGGDFYQFTTTTDTQPPTISSLGASVIAYDRAALTWVTDEQATSQIKYATVSGGPYTDTTETATYGSDHFVILPNLTSDTTYYFKAYSSDLSGNHTLSPQNSFKTLQDPSYQHDPLTEITGMSAPLITDTNAVISLTTDQGALCSIEYGTAPGNYMATPVTESLENKQHRITLPSLLFLTTYYYKATCIDNLDTSVSSDEASFTTLTEQVATGSETGDVTAPSISGVGTSAVTGENATVTWTTDEVGNGYVSYGITTSYGDMAGDILINAEIAKYSTDHIVLLKNLIPSTKYYYVVLSSDAKGNLATSSESSFTTTSPSTISSISILSTKIGEATLTWKTSTNMSSIIEYGLTETYGNKQESTTQSQDHTITVSKLKSNVLYHFRVKGQDKDKNLYASSDYTYEPKSPPQLRNIQSKVLSDNEAQIDFISSVPTDALITYTNTKDSKDTGSQGTPELQTTHSVILKNLTAGATYTGNIIAKDEAGNEVTEILKSFTTSQDTTPPVIDQMKTDMALSQDGKVQAITSFTTNEPTTQSVTYKEGTDGEEKTAGVKTEYTTSHIAIITAFKPGSVYFLTAHTTDKSGNVSLSKERMVITPQRTENVVQMIISNFNDIFSWAKM